MTIATTTKVMKRLITGPYGYNQAKRTTALADNGKMGIAGLAAKGDTDCSFSFGIAAYLGGLIDRDVLRGTFYTGNIRQKLTATGIYEAIAVSGWSVAKLRRECREGDALLGPGHVVYCLGDGRCASFESDENGRSAGGKVGDQTGNEGRFRDIYARSRGWQWILRPHSSVWFRTQILAAYSAGKPTEALLANYARQSPWDGPRWAWFMDAWAGWDKGMTIAYTPDELDKVPAKGHAFVVLGSALAKDGTITAKYRRRLELARDAAARFPNSRIIITGGKPSAGGLSEAEAGRGWLALAGVDPERLTLEDGSASTIGNARNTVPILRKLGVTRYTLVSDASHLRRASALFLAARIKIETAENKKLALASAGVLGFNDYAPKLVKPAGPIDSTSRATVTAEVKALLGL